MKFVLENNKFVMTMVDQANEYDILKDLSNHLSCHIHYF